MRHLRATIGEASRTTRWGDFARWAGGFLPIGFFAISALAIHYGYAQRLNLAAADVVAGIAFLVHVVIVVQFSLALFRAGKGQVGRRLTRLAGQFSLSFFTFWGTLAYINDAFNVGIFKDRFAVLLLWYAIVLLPMLVIFACCYGLGRMAKRDNGNHRPARNGA